MHHFHGDQFKSLLLESLDDVANEAALNGIGLEHDEGAFTVSKSRHGKGSLIAMDFLTVGQVRVGKSLIRLSLSYRM